MASELSPCRLEQDAAPPRAARPFVRLFMVLAIANFLIAGVLPPVGWGQDEKRHPALADLPRVTRTKRGISGDPLNVAFIGSLEDLHLAMLEAGWFPADPITLKSSLKIATGTIFHRTYVDAPVSNLVVWNRHQDLAFEQPAGKDPRRRHHVRFWRAALLDANGRPLWVGAATFDTHVGFSHTTGGITHHIDAEIDKERDKLVTDLRRTGNLASVYWVDGFHDKLTGKNGGGDPYHTDGRLEVGVLVTAEPFWQPATPARHDPGSAPAPATK